MALTHWDTEPTPPEMPQSFDCERFLSDYWDRRAKAEADEQDELQAWVSELTYNSESQDEDDEPAEDDGECRRCGEPCVMQDNGLCADCGAVYANQED